MKSFLYHWFKNVSITSKLPFVTGILALLITIELFTPKIYLYSQKQKQEWLFSVKDNRIGIVKKYTEETFIAFLRRDPIQVYEGRMTSRKENRISLYIEKNKNQIKNAA